MNNTEPGASEVAAFENDLKGRTGEGAALQQPGYRAGRRSGCIEIAKAGIPVVGVTETEPPGKNYQAWMLGELDAVDQALAGQPVSAIELRRRRASGSPAATILAGVSFAIQDGEFVGVLGPNGAGKTTLMRAVLGPDPGESAAVSVLGRPAARGNAAIGYMPQNRGAVAGLRLTGWDVVASAAMAAAGASVRLGKATRPRSTGRSIWSARKGSRAVRSARLSGGERQRLLLARRCIGRPRLLLLDEPLISLDPAHQHSVVEIARRICDELKIAILFSAHELNPLLGAIDRVLYLGDGAGGDRHGRRGSHRAGAVAPLRRRNRGRPRRGTAFRHVGGRRCGTRRTSSRRRSWPCPRSRRRPCLTMISCAPPSPPQGWRRFSAGTVGYFLVLRGQTFAGHALSLAFGLGLLFLHFYALPISG